MISNSDNNLNVVDNSEILFVFYLSKTKHSLCLENHNNNNMKLFGG